MGALAAFAQTGVLLTGAGYSVPPPPQVAPGQVTTFFFRGIGPAADGHLRSAQATTVPLPMNLGGLSLRMAQPQASAFAVPIFAVRQENACAGASDISAACLLTSVKVQIPFEIIADGTSPAPSAELTLDVDGKASAALPLQPVPDNAHIVTACDLSWDTNSTSVCDRHAYHANGQAISANDPAKPSEVVVVYAYGLGQVSGGLTTGDLSPAGSTLADLPNRVKASFGTVVNALSSGPRFLSSNDSATPSASIQFAGLTPGQIGLYQLNIPIPESLDLAGPCGGLGGFIRTNATLRVTTSQGSEGLAICVQP